MRAIPRPGLTLGLVLAAALLGGTARAAYRQATLSDFADIYSGPGEDFYVIEDADAGDQFPVVEQKGDWLKIRLTNGTGWILRAKAELAEVEGELAPAGGENAGGADSVDGAAEGGAGEAVQAVVKDKVAKLLGKPQATAVVVKKLPKGTHLEVVQRSADGRWYKVRHDGPLAWVKASAVRLVGIEPDAVADAVPVDDGRPRSEGRRLTDTAPSGEPSSGLQLLAGIGLARLQQRWSTDQRGAYAYPNYQPPGDYDNAAPGPALLLGASYWFTPHLGLEAGSRLVVASKGVEIRDPGYTADPLTLTVASYEFEGGLRARWSVLKPGAWIAGRLGYRYYRFAWDEAAPEPALVGGATSPLWWSTTYHGPSVGLGVRFPFTDWIGLELTGDAVPLAFASNAYEGEAGDAETPSGDVESAWGMGVTGALWFTVRQEAPSVTAEFRSFYDYFQSSYRVPQGAAVPRAQAPYLAYTTAEAGEQTVGATAAVTLRF